MRSTITPPEGQRIDLAKALLRKDMTGNEIAKTVVDEAFDVHEGIGPGLLENVYEIILADELEQRGSSVCRKVPVVVSYRGHVLDEGFRADMIVSDKVIVELKSLETVKDVYKMQLLTYLKLSGKKLGLLINFGEPLIKDGIKRIVNGL